VLLFVVHSVVIYGTGCYYLGYTVLLFVVEGIIIYGIRCYYLRERD
jgi:hypothetical protein